MIHLIRLGCVLGGILLCLLATTSGALAHAALDRSEPAAGAVLPTPPTAVRIWFTEPLEPRFTRADLLDASGQAVPGATSGIAPENDHELVLTLPAGLPDGGYTVAWRNVSSADGHNLQGYFGIRIGEGGAPGSMPAAGSVAPASPARELSRGLALIGLALLLAIAPVTLGVVTPVVQAAPALTNALIRRLRQYALVAIVVALLGSVAALVTQAAAIAPDLALPSAVAETLAGARYGELWLWRLLGLLVVAAGVIAALWGPVRWQRQAMWLAALAGLAAPLPF
ncbi:MAG: copper resistance protein CopC, partial [Thermomicrobiales bacterium]